MHDAPKISSKNPSEASAADSETLEQQLREEKVMIDTLEATLPDSSNTFAEGQVCTAENAREQIGVENVALMVSLLRGYNNKGILISSLSKPKWPDYGNFPGTNIAFAAVIPQYRIHRPKLDVHVSNISPKKFLEIATGFCADPENFKVPYSGRYDEVNVNVYDHHGRDMSRQMGLIPHEEFINARIDAVRQSILDSYGVTVERKLNGYDQQYGGKDTGLDLYYTLVNARLILEKLGEREREYLRGKTLSMRNRGEVRLSYDREGVVECGLPERSSYGVSKYADDIKTLLVNMRADERIDSIKSSIPKLSLDYLPGAHFNRVRDAARFSLERIEAQYQSGSLRWYFQDEDLVPHVNVLFPIKPGGRDDMGGFEEFDDSFSLGIVPHRREYRGRKVLEKGVVINAGIYARPSGIERAFEDFEKMLEVKVPIEDWGHKKIRFIRDELTHKHGVTFSKGWGEKSRDPKYLKDHIAYLKILEEEAGRARGSGGIKVHVETMHEGRLKLSPKAWVTRQQGKVIINADVGVTNESLRKIIGGAFSL